MKKRPTGMSHFLKKGLRVPSWVPWLKRFFFFLEYFLLFKHNSLTFDRSAILPFFHQAKFHLSFSLTIFYLFGVSNSNIFSWSVGLYQCDQIGAIYLTLGNFLSLWQQLICPNLPHSLTIFVKVSKFIIFKVKSFLGNFWRHLAIFFWSHWSLCSFL